MVLGLGRDGKQRLIASVPLFAGLSKKEVAQVASIADELDFKAEIALKVMQAVGDRLPADVDQFALSPRTRAARRPR